MPNVPYLSDDEIANNTPVDLLTAISARRKGGKLLNLDRMLLHSEPIARGWNLYMGAIRKDLQVSPILRELAICAIARLNRADYEWFQHAPEFLAAGGRQSQLDALGKIGNTNFDRAEFDRAELATLNLTREMSQNIEVSPATMNEIRAALPSNQVVEIVTVIAAYNMVSRFLVALGVTAEGEAAG